MKISDGIINALPPYFLLQISLSTRLSSAIKLFEFFPSLPPRDRLGKRKGSDSQPGYQIFISKPISWNNEKGSKAGKYVKENTQKSVRKNPTIRVF